MSAKKPVVVYGVSGYTGRLVCEYLREYNVPFIAAGREACFDDFWAVFDKRAHHIADDLGAAEQPG